MSELRIDRHPVLGDPEGEELSFTVDGTEVVARSTDTIAGALWANGRRVLRTSRSGQPRGLYCGIGHCFECRVTVDGTPGVRACITRVGAGMIVETDSERREERA